MSARQTRPCLAAAALVLHLGALPSLAALWNLDLQYHNVGPDTFQPNSKCSLHGDNLYCISMVGSSTFQVLTVKDGLVLSRVEFDLSDHLGRTCSYSAPDIDENGRLYGLVDGLFPGEPLPFRGFLFEFPQGSRKATLVTPGRRGLGMVDLKHRKVGWSEGWSEFGLINLDEGSVEERFSGPYGLFAVSGGRLFVANKTAMFEVRGSQAVPVASWARTGRSVVRLLGFDTFVVVVVRSRFGPEIPYFFDNRTTGLFAIPDAALSLWGSSGSVDITRIGDGLLLFDRHGQPRFAVGQDHQTLLLDCGLELDRATLFSGRESTVIGWLLEDAYFLLEPTSCREDTPFPLEHFALRNTTGELNEPEAWLNESAEEEPDDSNE